MKHLRNVLKTNTAKIALAAALVLLGSYGLTHAGSLTPLTTPAPTFYTFNDIYTRLTTNATSTEGNHSLSTTSSPTSTFYTLTQIYNAIPTILSAKVATGTTYLGIAGTAAVITGIGTGTEAASTTVITGSYAWDHNGNVIQGSASAGYAFPSKPLKTGQTICKDPSSFATISCANTGEDGQYQSGQARSYTDNGDGTITDNNTGLMWQKCTVGKSGSNCSTGSRTAMNWSSATTTCISLNLGGHNDWRLPNLLEYYSITDIDHSNGDYDDVYFPDGNANTGNYWTSTIGSAGGSHNAAINVNGYLVTAISWGDSSEYARCVRG